ncbi:MAG: hypothetical protein E6G67_06115 [Actinobacteria bacterium]|nr:MAG: hypothetical protein E6G67_06115 [Actinomycetota bacterium]
MRKDKEETRSGAEPLSQEELEAAKGEPLPNRESMSTLDPMPKLPADDLDGLMPTDPIPKP